MADIKLTFKGQDYLIPDSKAFQAGAVVEEIATLFRVLQWFKDPPLHKMAQCHGALLRFAGAKVSDAEVHAELLMASTSGAQFVTASLESLVSVLMDGAPMDALAGKAKDGPDAEKPTAS